MTSFIIPVATIILSIAITLGALTQTKSSTTIREDPPVQAITTQSKEFRLPQLQIDQIFSDDHQWTATLSGEKSQVMIATGDIIPARSVNVRTLKSGRFTWPYEKVATVLKDADITFANLESPLIKDCQSTEEGMSFCGDQRHIEGLLFGGVDVVNLANNHTTNHGKEGLIQTVDLMKQNNILTAGVSGPQYKTLDGVTFAFLGYNEVGQTPGIAQAESELIATEVQNARSKADIVIVAFHWGVEYVSQPSSNQKMLAHLAVDNGADLIIGNHPHWIQPVELYKGKLITYAHGNFIFDQMWSQETREGVLGRYTFYNKQLADVEFLPIQIDDYGQPHFVDGTQKEKILQNMKTESQVLAQNYE